MYQSTYYVDKTTDTFADTLLERLLQANVGQATVQVQDAAGLLAERLPRIKKSTMAGNRKSCISRSEVISASAPVG
jgi:hypothetical protein